MLVCMSLYIKGQETTDDRTKGGSGSSYKRKGRKEGRKRLIILMKALSNNW